MPFRIESSGGISEKLSLSIGGAIEDFARKLSIAEMDTVRIFLAHNRREFDSLTAGTIPDWGIGSADPVNRRIVILVEDYDISRKSLGILKHELAHIFLRGAIGDVRIPRWFDEGFAQWASGAMELSQASRLAFTAIFGELIPLRELDDMNLWDSEKAQLAYAQSYSAFEVLLKYSPANSPYEIIRAIAEQGDFDKGILTSTGMTPSQFHIIWRKEVSRKYDFTILLADWRYLFAFLTLVFVILGMAKILLLRKRKQAQFTEQDESDKTED